MLPVFIRMRTWPGFDGFVVVSRHGERDFRLNERLQGGAASRANYYE